MKKKKVGIILVSALAIAVAAVIAVNTSKTTISSYHSNDVANNKFYTQDLFISLRDEVNKDEIWRGKRIRKEVGVINQESTNVVVRIALIPRWTDDEGKAWPGDTSYLRYHFSEFLSIANDTSIPPLNWVATKPDLNEEQYFYYNGVLKAEEESNLLLKQISLFTEADYEAMTPEEKLNAGSYLPRSLNDRYKGKKIVVEVKAEAVQAKEEAIKATWGETTGNPKIDEMLKTLCESNK